MSRGANTLRGREAVQLWMTPQLAGANKRRQRVKRQWHDYRQCSLDKQVVNRRQRQLFVERWQHFERLQGWEWEAAGQNGT
jgi:hypothetical protein